MNTSKRTKKHSSYNKDILICLAEKYAYSLDYIRKCLRADRKGIMPDLIKKEYAAADLASKNAIKNKINQ